MAQGKNPFLGLISFLLTVLLVFILPLYFAYHSSLWEAIENMSEEAQAFLVIFGGIGIAILAKRVERRINTFLRGEEKSTVVVLAVPPPDVVVGVAVPSQNLKEPERSNLKSFIIIFLWVLNGFLFLVAVMNRIFGGNGLVSFYHPIMEQFSFEGGIILGLLLFGYLAWLSLKEIGKKDFSLSERFLGKEVKTPETLMGMFVGVGQFLAGFVGTALLGLLIFSFVSEEGFKGVGNAFGRVTIWEQANWIFGSLYFLYISFLMGMEHGWAYEKKRGL